MSCIDDQYQEFVVMPLRDARKDLEWIIRQSQRQSLTPQLLQKAIRGVGQKLRIADSYFEGLLLE